MKLNAQFLQRTAIAVFCVALSGCATNGGQQNGFGDALNNVGDAFQGVAAGLGSAVVFHPLMPSCPFPGDPVQGRH